MTINFACTYPFSAQLIDCIMFHSNNDGGGVGTAYDFILGNENMIPLNQTKKVHLHELYAPC